LKPAELAHIINLSKPAAVFTLAGKDGVDILREALTHVENEEVVKSYKTKNRIFSVDLAADDYGLCLNHQHGATSDWKTLLDGEDDKLGFPQYQQDSDENDRRAAVILWSSGTSGKSKGVILGHRAILVSVQSLFYGNPLFGPNEVFIGFAPFFHVL
jgi:acyl-CoA synthetase (AMP-forming)/AMP-acid ligase II